MWVEINTPKDSLVTYTQPEYMKVITLSSNLTKDITTVPFGCEPTVDTSRKDLIEQGFLKVELDAYGVEDEESFKNLHKKYDFVNSNM